MKETLERVIAYVRGIWRYHWLAMGVAWIIVLVGWLGVPRLSVPLYTARTQVYIDTETVLRPLLQGLTLDVTPSEQLGLMTRQLMSRPNLEQVVRSVGLNRQGQTPQPLDVAIEKLKSNISLQAERTSSDSKYLNYYVISYTDKNPQLAKKVVEELITAFVQNTLEEIRRDSERAKQFIDQQITESREKLAASENRLREFKQKNVNLLPEEGKSFFESLQSAQAALKEVELQIRETKSHRRELQTQLRNTAAVQKATSAGGKPILTPVESRLLALQAKLDQLLLRFTEAHPDVVETRASIAELEKQRQGELRSGIGPTEVNPIYQQLKLKLADVEGELAGLQTKQEEYHHRVQALQQQIETLPMVEDDLLRLNRDYEINRKNYQDLVARRHSMTMSESVEQSSEGKKFRVMEPPNVPVDTVLNDIQKKRLFLITGILAAGLGGGLGLAFLLSQIRPVVYSQRTLSELTGLPVVGVIARVSTFSSNARRRLGLTTFAATGLMMFVAYGIVLLVQLGKVDMSEIPVLDGVLKTLGGGG